MFQREYAARIQYTKEKFENFKITNSLKGRFGVIFNLKRLGILLSCAAFTGLYCTINVHRVLFVIPIVIWILNQRKVLNFTGSNGIKSNLMQQKMSAIKANQ